MKASTSNIGRASMNVVQSNLRKPPENLGHHHTFQWIPTQLGEETKDLEDEEVMETYGVPYPVLIKSITLQIDHEEAFLTLPWALLLPVIFAVCLIGHERTNDLRTIEEAMAVDLHENAVFAFSTPYNMGHKDLYDAHSISDIYSWLRIGLVPLLFRTHQSWSELQQDAREWIDVPLTETQKNAYLQYNRLIGGARLSQSRASVSACDNEQVSETYDMWCVPSENAVDMDLSYQPEYLDIKSAKSRFDAKLTRWLLLEDRSSVEERLRQLELSGWIDNTTVHVAVHFLVYNAHYNSLTLTEAHFLFARSGRLWKKIVHSAFFLNPYWHSWVIVFDVIFVLLTIRLNFIEFNEFVKALMSRRPGTGCQWFADYIDVWNVVDWVSIGLAWILILFWALVVYKANSLGDHLMDVSMEEAALQSAAMKDRGLAAIFEDHVSEILDDFKSTLSTQLQWRFMACVFPLCLMLRLFKAFSAQPRLALVTETLSWVAVDVLHFLIVFASIFFTFVLMAMALFGGEMPEFSTWERACNACFLVLMGEFDFEAMFAEARQMGAIWFWMFQILLVLLMLNMLLAIIMDAYTEVKGKSMATQTLPQQLFQAIQRRRWIKSGQGLPLRQIRNGLDERFGKLRGTDLEKALTHHPSLSQAALLKAPALAEMVGGLQLPQAEALIKNAIERWRENHSNPLSLSEAMGVIGLIYEEVMKSSKSIGKVGAHAASVHHLLTDQQQDPAEDFKGDRIDKLESALMATNEKLDRMEKSTNEKLDRLEKMMIRAFADPCFLPSKVEDVMIKREESARLAL